MKTGFVTMWLISSCLVLFIVCMLLDEQVFFLQIFWYLIGKAEKSEIMHSEGCSLTPYQGYRKVNFYPDV